MDKPIPNTINPVTIEHILALMSQMPQYSERFRHFRDEPGSFVIYTHIFLKSRALPTMRRRLEYPREEDKEEVVGLGEAIDLIEQHDSDYAVQINLGFLTQYNLEYTLYSDIVFAKALGAYFYEQGKVVREPILQNGRPSGQFVNTTKKIPVSMLQVWELVAQLQHHYDRFALLRAEPRAFLINAIIFPRLGALRTINIRSKYARKTYNIDIVGIGEVIANMEMLTDEFAVQIMLAYQTEDNNKYSIYADQSLKAALGATFLDEKRGVVFEILSS
jgi:hypothetical protein